MVLLQVRSRHCKKRLLASCLSVRPHEINSSPTGQIFMKFDLCILENLSGKYNFLKKSDKNNRGLHHVSGSVVLEMSIVKKKN